MPCYFILMNEQNQNEIKNDSKTIYLILLQNKVTYSTLSLK